MQLTWKTPIDQHQICRMVSENWLWQLRLDEIDGYGVIRIHQTGSRFFTVEYLGGNSEARQIEVHLLICRIMFRLPEVISENEMRKILPKPNGGPVYRDAACWTALQTLAAANLTPATRALQSSSAAR